MRTYGFLDDDDVVQAGDEIRCLWLIDDGITVDDYRTMNWQPVSDYWIGKTFKQLNSSNVMMYEARRGLI